MDNNEQDIILPNWWVEYVDDYSIKHLTPIQNENDLKYLQKNYYARIVEYVGV